MMRRMFWFVCGAIAGASAVVWVKRTIVTVSEKLTPANIADAITAGLRRSVVALSDGVMSLIDAYRNREDSGPASTSSPMPSSSTAQARRHNPPRQRTSHR
ncbi:MAG: hypothetical protein JHC59_05905 [Ilumatobacteraceae bacterium]|jgi:hypothetical protein|nr:hypothetical protein [Ilumatobacteraceae bacterium]